jgi:hypothetical protein
MRPVSYITAPLLVGIAYAIPFTGIRRKHPAPIRRDTLSGSANLDDTQDTGYFVNL